MVVHDIDLLEIGVLLNEIKDIDNPNNRYVTYQQLPWFQIEFETELNLNLDGEPIRDRTFRFEALPERLRVFLPLDTTMVSRP
jgi:diacylglycerol kinase family enzyme